ncbi:hypothetical protein [Yoonia sediminilitoris]|uniref:Uncharacterized protein n=1 Tax=Yoonia sediminilitoris TaxID=1286148 RepID=A0A2T6KDV3_9RHOB|nr:hypothetical protein [Yoonia sediminilitoris]PUB13191.1 hypothetical protein C8N45_108112 [Yoonia sediminilitoris]RCW94526.1 hypothetical protein DFP92_108113 [Yoonia sediminilitoris]
MIAISCYVAGVPAPIPATQFDNACKPLLAGGIPYQDLKTTRSNQLADYYKIDHPPLRAHDARRCSIRHYVLQHLLRSVALDMAAFDTYQTMTL